MSHGLLCPTCLASHILSCPAVLCLICFVPYVSLILMRFVTQVLLCPTCIVTHVPSHPEWLVSCLLLCLTCFVFFSTCSRVPRASGFASSAASHALCCNFSCEPRALCLTCLVLYVPSYSMSIFFYVSFLMLLTFSILCANITLCACYASRTYFTVHCLVVIFSGEFT